VNFDLQADEGSKRAELPAGTVNAQDAAVPENARKEFSKGQDLLLKENKVEDAVSHLRKATEMYDGYAQAYSLLGLAYLHMGMPKEAHAALEKAMKLDPNSGPAYLTYGMLLNAEKDFAGARKALERGVELQPDAPEGHFELAKACFAQGEWQAAEPHALKAVALQANLAPAHILLGNIALKKQDKDGALKEFREYLRIDPKGPFAGGVAQMIQKLEQASKN
jgi:tetratricopeptide (TPR) repeat protein